MTHATEKEMSDLSNKTIFTMNRLVLGMSLISTSLSAMYATAHTQEIVQLPVISLQAQEDEERYILSHSNAATKLNLALKDTPQSVSILSAEQMQQQQISTVGEALNQVTGIFMRRLGAQGVMGVGGEYNSFYARGSQIHNYSMDGVMSSAAIEGQSGLSVSKLDPSIYEYITVVKGATGLSTGAGYPSATVDLKRKLAKAYTAQGKLGITSSSFEHKFAGLKYLLDYQTPLNETGSLRGRTVLSYQDKNSFMSRGEQNNAVFYSTLAFDPTANSTVDAGLMYQRSNVHGLSVHSTALFANNIAAYQPWFYNSAPNWSYANTDTYNAFINAKHHLNDQWDVFLNYNYLQQKTDGLWGVVGFPDRNVDFKAGKGRVSAGSKQFDIAMHGIDSYVAGNFDLNSALDIDLAMGGSYQQSQSKDHYSYTVGKDWVELANWNGEIARPVDLLTANKTFTVTQSSQYSAYVATRFNLFENIHALVGARSSSYDISSIKNDKAHRQYTGHNIVTPYAGLVYELIPAMSIYGSYTNIFLPQNKKDMQEKFLDPLQGNNYEMGLKGSFYDDALNMSVAYFQSVIDNKAEYTGISSANERYYRAVRGAKTKGYELELAGQVTPSWTLSSGYTYATTTEQGKKIQLDQPKQMLKLHSVYQLPAAFAQWKVGASLRWQSEILNAAAKSVEAITASKQKSYLITDLMLKYDIDQNNSIGLNINNIANQKYRLNVDNTTFGEPRNYVLSLNYKF